LRTIRILVSLIAILAIVWAVHRILSNPGTAKRMNRLDDSLAGNVAQLAVEAAPGAETAVLIRFEESGGFGGPLVRPYFLERLRDALEGEGMKVEEALLPLPPDFEKDPDFMVTGDFLGILRTHRKAGLVLSVAGCPRLTAEDLDPLRPLSPVVVVTAMDLPWLETLPEGFPDILIYPRKQIDKQATRPVDRFFQVRRAGSPPS